MHTLASTPTHRSHGHTCTNIHKAEGQEHMKAAMRVKCAEVGGVILSRIWSMYYYANEIKSACLPNLENPRTNIYH